MKSVMTIPNSILLAEVESMLRNGTEVTLRTKGDSMLPFIEGGRDSVVLTRADSFSTGDIVLARTLNGNYVLHRIIGEDAGTVILMGDGNLKGTERCLRKDICGKVSTVIRGSRRIDPESRTEKIKSRLWLQTRPVRRYLLAIYRRIHFRKNNS